MNTGVMNISSELHEGAVVGLACEAQQLHLTR